MTKETDAARHAGAVPMADTAASKFAKKRAGRRRRRGKKAVPDTTVTRTMESDKPTCPAQEAAAGTRQTQQVGKSSGSNLKPAAAS